MSDPLRPERERFLGTLEIVRRELVHLNRTRDRLAGKPLDRSWVEGLEKNFDDADLLESFVSRYGRLQDTIGGKLLPRALLAVAERPGAMLDNLSRAERLSWVESENAWIEAREIRNRVVHEYMTDPEQFSRDIRAALDFVPLFQNAYSAFLALAEKQFGVAESELVNYFRKR